MDFASGVSPVMDTRIVKSLLSISSFRRNESAAPLPPVVAELFDVQKIPVATSAYPGEISVIPSDSLISRLLAQNIRHQGLSHIYAELLSHSVNNQIYIRELPQLTGHPVETLHPMFPKAILMGVLEESGTGLAPFLNPSGGFIAKKGNRFVFLAERYEDTLPEPGHASGPLERGTSMGGKVIKTGRRILILGWNRRVPTLLSEFESYHGERFDIDIISLLPIPEREHLLGRYGNRVEKVNINHIHGDYTALRDLLDLGPGAYDNILMLSSDRVDSGEEADARTIFGYVLLRDILPPAAKQPEIIIELMDAENDKLFEKHTGEVIISPLVLSRILAHVALRPELNVVFEELFTTAGAEIYFRPASEYGIAPGTLSFKDIQECVTKRGDTALGIRKTGHLQSPRGGIELNPDRDVPLRIEGGDEIVVLTTYM